MFGSFFKPLYFSIIGIVITILFITIFFTPLMSEEMLAGFDTNQIQDYALSSSGFIWPTPGYTRINSPFGKRVSPTAGASNFHKGIDIGAPEGSKIIAVVSGTITYTGFLGGGGYTITLSKDNMKISYCHVSPVYIVKESDEVIQGQVIGFVGPKNVYGVVGNQYKDSNGNPTNGATTGPHLHLGIRVDGNYVNPLNYY